MRLRANNVPLALVLRARDMARYEREREGDFQVPPLERFYDPVSSFFFLH